MSSFYYHLGRDEEAVRKHGHESSVTAALTLLANRYLLCAPLWRLKTQVVSSQSWSSTLVLHEQNKTGGAITQKIYPGVEVHNFNPSIETDGSV